MERFNRFLRRLERAYVIFIKNLTRCHSQKTHENSGCSTEEWWEIGSHCFPDFATYSPKLAGRIINLENVSPCWFAFQWFKIFNFKNVLRINRWSLNFGTDGRKDYDGKGTFSIINPWKLTQVSWYFMASSSVCSRWIWCTTKTRRAPMSFFKSVAFLVGMLVPKDTLCLGFEEWWQPGYRIVCYLFRDTGMDSTTEEVCDLYCIFIFTDAYDVDICVRIAL